jgi:segregation and condensation protein A
LFELLKASGGHLRRRQDVQPLLIQTSELSSVEDALERLRRGLGSFPGWENLWRYLPPGTFEGLGQGRLAARSAMAATFAASLELVKQGGVKLRQGKPYGPIYLRAADRDNDQR